MFVGRKWKRSHGVDANNLRLPIPNNWETGEGKLE